MKRSKKVYFLTWLSACLFLAFALPACTGGSGNGPSTAIENYLTALVEEDSARLSALSCADWEDDAALELESLAAVTASLEDLACQQSGSDAGTVATDTVVVSCSGILKANYNGEDQEINLADRNYLAVQEGGDWRMCGYQ